LEDDDKCYLQPFLLNERMEYTEEIYKEMASMIARQGPAYNDLKKKSLLSKKEHPRLPKAANTMDCSSIHFKYNDAEVSQDSRKAYSEAINHDLIQCLDATGAMHVCHERLREALIIEHNFIELRNAIKHRKMDQINSYLLLIDAMPCIMHLEMHIGIKIIAMILHSGMSNTVSGESENDTILSFWMSTG